MNKDYSDIHKGYEERKYPCGVVHFGKDGIFIDLSSSLKIIMVMLAVTLLTFLFLKGWGFIPLLILLISLFVQRSGLFGADPLMDDKIFIYKDGSVKGMSFRGVIRERGDIGTINKFSIRRLPMQRSHPLYQLVAVGSRRDIIVLAYKERSALEEAKQDLDVFFGFS